jgi:hypothetical protein
MICFKFQPDMACTESSPRKQSTFDTPKKKRKRDHHDEEPKITKETLLKVLEGVENEITKLGQETLQERLNELRGQVKVVLENQEEEIRRLCDQVRNLEKEVESQKAKIENLEKEVESQKAKNANLEEALAVARATWVWELHLARFVVDSSEKIYESYWIDQMEIYLKNVNPRPNRFTKIQDKLTEWTTKHWNLVYRVRNERNYMAHPNLIHLDLVESEIKRRHPEHQKLLRDMLDELKMTASLMKFGRLADFYIRNKLFPTQGERGKRGDALTNISSWNCHFEDIGGLQNIEHEEAKRYLAKYVDDRRMIDHYVFIVDFIKDGNSKRMGKLALEIEGSGMLDGLSTEYGEVLNQLKKLLPNRSDESVVKGLDKAVAKLHVPDFLPKHLWKHGIEIVEKYFKLKN